MNNRRTELEAYIQEYRDQRLQDKKKFMFCHYQELIPAFCSKLDLMITEQTIKQDAGVQGQVKYFTCFRLRSSQYTESFEMALGMSNQHLFLDKHKSCVYWSPPILYHDIKKDVTDLERLLQKEFLNLEKDERFWLKQLLLDDNWNAFQPTIKKMVEETAEKIITSSLVMEPEIEVLYGDYIDQITLVRKLKAEGSVQ